MKTLFFIAALAGAVYLIMQTPAGKAWFAENEPKLDVQQAPQKEQHVSSQVAQSVTDKMTEFAQRLNQKQQTQINQLENRISELENELVMGRISQQQNISSSKVTLHPYNQPEKQLVALPFEQDFDVGVPTSETLVATSDKELRRNRQARLQDIAQKMEMSSLQALVN